MGAIVFDQKKFGEVIPEGFNAIRIFLDGRLSSDLNWSESIENAKKYIDEGFKIFWEIDLGILEGLRYPLLQQSQFLSLKLSLEHFSNLFDEHLIEKSVGVALYRGDIDFTHDFIWSGEQEKNFREWLEEHFEYIENLNRELGSKYSNFSEVMSSSFPSKELLHLYCRDVTAHYLDMLSNYIPIGIEPYILLESETIDHPVHQANLTSKEYFPHLKIANGKGLFIEQDMQWGGEFYVDEYIGEILAVKKKKAAVGVCIPSAKLFKPSQYDSFNEVFSSLSQKKIPFRVIPETQITHLWDGLDYLIVSGESLTPKGKRMVMGFCAAGGTIIRCGDISVVPDELTLEYFMTI